MTSNAMHTMWRLQERDE